MGPELLGAGLVFLQRAVFVRLLRIGCSDACDNTDCRERKNRSMESRFHRVTPLKAAEAAALFIMDVSRDLRSERIRRQNVSTSGAREKRGERRNEASEMKLRKIFLDRLWIETILCRFRCDAIYE